MQASLREQLGAYEALKAASRLEAKRKADALGATPPPEALVGEKLEVQRAGKWKAAKVTRYDVPSGRHEVQDLQSGNAKGAVSTELLSLLGAGAERWRRRDEHVPAPKFVWAAEVERALLEVTQLQLALADREHEWARHALPADLAGRSQAHIAAHSKWGSERAEHPELVGILERLQKVFPSKAWMSVPKLKEHMLKLHATAKAMGVASAVAAAQHAAGAAAAPAAPGGPAPLPAAGIALALD